MLIPANINLEDEKEDKDIPEIKFEFERVHEIIHLPNNSFTGNQISLPET